MKLLIGKFKKIQESEKCENYAILKAIGCKHLISNLANFVLK
jgi:hypothetical protein